MAWSQPMPLTIAQPLGWEYFKWTHIATSRTEPALPVGRRAEAEDTPHAHRGPRAASKSYVREQLPRLLAALLVRDLTREEIESALGLRRWQTSHLIYRAELGGWVRQKRRRDRCGSQLSSVTSLTDEGRAEAERVQP